MESPSSARISRAARIAQNVGQTVFMQHDLVRDNENRDRMRKIYSVLDANNHYKMKRNCRSLNLLTQPAEIDVHRFISGKRQTSDSHV